MKTVKTHSCFGKPVKVLLLAIIFATGALTNPVAQAQIPPTPNMETIPVGSWIIAMDNDNQGISGVMNVRAYGLAVELLWANIPLKWAIKSGKAKDEADVRVRAPQVFPSFIADPKLPGRNWNNSATGGEYSPALAISSSSGGSNSTTNKFNGSASWRLGRGNQITFANVDVSLYRDVTLQVAFASGGTAGQVPDIGQNLVMEISYNGGTNWVVVDTLVKGDGSTNLNINTTASNTVGSNPYTIQIPSNATQAMVRFSFPNIGSGTKYYYIDDVIFSGSYVHSFVAGPLIIMPADTAAARSVINAYNAPLAAASKIKIYETEEVTQADIRYTLTHKPYIAVFNDGGNATIHENNLLLAGITSSRYQRINAGTPIDTLSCFTMASEPHWATSTYNSNDSMRLNNLKFFLETGGNFLAQCAAVEAIENFKGDNFLMTNGLLKRGDAASAAQVQFMNADMPQMQFQGTFKDAGGSLNSFLPNATSNWRANSALGVYFLKDVIKDSGLDTLAHVAFIKLSPGYIPGGQITYLSGHNYGGSALEDVNGLRVYFNSILLPVNRAIPIGNAYASVPSLCVNDTLKLFVNPPAGSHTYLWTGPNGFTSTQQNPVIPNFNASKAGQYTVTLTTSGQCQFTYPPITVSFIESNIGDVNATSVLAGCISEDGGQSILEVTAPLEGTGSWSVVSGPGQITDPAALLTSITGLSTTGTSTTVKWLVTTPQGCKDSSQVTIHPTVVNPNSVSKYDNEFCLNCPINIEGWYYFYDPTGKILAAVDGTAMPAAQAEFCARLTYALPGDPNEDDVPLVAATYAVVQPYLPRYWQLKGQPNVMVPVKVYFTDQELAALMGWCNRGSIYEFNSVNALYVTYYAENPGAFTLPGSAGGVLLTPQIIRVGEHWQASFSVPGHSTFYLHPIEFGGAPLPVELVSLDAQPLESTILVKWQTASERNASRYEVERSTDGVNFLKVSVVSASGHSNSLRNYFFEDVHVEKNVRYYYRLKQVDYDGSFTHTHTVSAVIESKATLRIGDFFPNPSRAEVAVSIIMPEYGDITFRLFSLEGRQVDAGLYELNSGTNELRFDLSALPAGTYVGQFSSAYGNETKKLVKAK